MQDFALTGFEKIKDCFPQGTVFDKDSEEELSKGLIQSIADYSSEAHFWATINSAIAIHNASFETFPVESPVHLIGDGEYTVTNAEALSHAMEIMQFQCSSALKQAYITLMDEHPLVLSEGASSNLALLNSRIYGSFQPFFIRQEEVSPHAVLWDRLEKHSDLNESGYRILSIDCVAAGKIQRNRNVPVALRGSPFDCGEKANASRAIVHFTSDSPGKKDVYMLCWPKVMFLPNGFPVWYESCNVPDPLRRKTGLAVPSHFVVC